MIWSGWDRDLGLELYLNNSHPSNANQPSENKSLIDFLDRHRLRDRIDVQTLNGLNAYPDFFEIIKDPSIKVKLPFLVVAYGCETGAILGYSGLEEVTAQITNLLL